MTDEQRAQIREMRERGFGYAAVAKAAGLSKGSVKAYCRAHGLSGVRAGSRAGKERVCPFCGNPLVRTHGGRKRRFCSDVCRVSWWNSHPKAVNRKAVYSFVCARCRKEFTAYGNSRRKYCSHAC